ncbi:MAG: Fic family protein [Dehalococcoidia bacterium]
MRLILQQPIDFTSTDTESTLTKVRLLSAAATYFNLLAVSEFGGRGRPVRGVGLVEQVVGAAFQTFGGEDPHPDNFGKAALLLRGVTQRHLFNDGTKRGGFLLAAYYLCRAGVSVPTQLPESAIVELCMRVSAGELSDIIVLAAELRRLWQAAYTTHSSAMPEAPIVTPVILLSSRISYSSRSTLCRSRPHSAVTDLPARKAHLGSAAVAR